MNQSYQDDGSGADVVVLMGVVVVKNSSQPLVDKVLLVKGGTVLDSKCTVLVSVLRLLDRYSVTVLLG